MLLDDRALAHATAAASVSVKQPKVRRSMHKGAWNICYLHRSCRAGPALILSDTTLQLQSVRHGERLLLKAFCCVTALSQMLLASAGACQGVSKRHGRNSLPAAGGGAPCAMERRRQCQRWECRGRRRFWWRLRLLAAYRVAGARRRCRAGVHSAPAALMSVSSVFQTIFLRTTVTWQDCIAINWDSLCEAALIVVWTSHFGLDSTLCRLRTSAGT